MGNGKSRHRPAELTGPEVEVQRLRQVFWEILRASGADLRGYRKAPGPGEHSPDVPEWALERVGELVAEMEEYTGISGADINPEAGPDEVCTCGEVISWHRDTWMHLFNHNLRRYTSHTARPSTGFYNPVERAALAARAETTRRDVERNVPGEAPTWAEMRRAVDPYATTATGGNFTSITPDWQLRPDGRIEAYPAGAVPDRPRERELSPDDYRRARETHRRLSEFIVDNPIVDDADDMEGDDN